MISLVDISASYDLAISTSILAVDCEISLYGIGSFHAGNIIRNKLNYLEIYSNCLSTIIDFTNTGIGDYTNLGFTDDEVTACIENINELTGIIFETN